MPSQASSSCIIWIVSRTLLQQVDGTFRNPFCGDLRALNMIITTIIKNPWGFPQGVRSQAMLASAIPTSLNIGRRGKTIQNPWGLPQRVRSQAMLASAVPTSLNVGRRGKTIQNPWGLPQGVRSQTMFASAIPFRPETGG